MTSTHLFSLDRDDLIAHTFEVDGTEYSLYSAERLSPEDEATLIGLFSKAGKLAQKLEHAAEKEAVRIAGEVREVRTKIIAMFTDCPREVAETLGVKSQSALLAAITDEMTAKDADA